MCFFSGRKVKRNWIFTLRLFDFEGGRKHPRSDGMKRLVGWNFAVVSVWFSCCKRQNPSEKRQKLILPTIQFGSERVATSSNPRLFLLRNRNLAFLCGGGGVVFFGAVWHLSVTCVCQFHSFIHAVCNYTVLLRGRFSLGPLYSLDVVEEELVKHHLKWEKELDRRGVDSRDAGEGHGVGAVVQRWRGKCPDSAGGGVGRRVTGLNDITSCPSAFPVTCPPFYGATLQRCCGEPSNAHRHVWGILRRHGERRERRSEQTQPHGPRARGTLEIWLTLSLWKGFRKFPPISPSSLGVPGWLFILRLPGEFWGEEGAKVKTEQYVTTKQSCKC